MASKNPKFYVDIFDSFQIILKAILIKTRGKGALLQKY